MPTDTISQAPYRSEAFAEDLDESSHTPPPAGPLRKSVRVLLGLMPAIVALMSALAAVRVPPA